jgi:hypothetical protein
MGRQSDDESWAGKDANSQPVSFAYESTVARGDMASALAGRASSTAKKRRPDGFD